MYRYQVPVDDQIHTIPTTSAPVHIASRTPGIVEFWAELDDEAEPWDTRYIVVGTGHAIPTGAKYVGTTEAEFGLVWHLYETPPWARHDAGR